MCGGWDSNPRTPEGRGPEPRAVDQAGRPPRCLTSQSFGLIILIIQSLVSTLSAVSLLPKFTHTVSRIKFWRNFLSEAFNIAIMTGPVIFWEKACSLEPRVGFGLTTFALPRQRSNQLSYRGSTKTNRMPFLIVEGNLGASIFS